MVSRVGPGPVLWLTGLSGAGKTTIATHVDAVLRARGVPTECLDGDAVRSIASAGFSRAERDAHIRRVGFFASRFADHGITVVCALISPYAESRAYVRRLCPNFVEIYISTPLDECERRDTKGLYARARQGAISNFTGIDDPYEPPEHPEVTIDTTEISCEEAGSIVLAAWAERTRQPWLPTGD